MRELLAATTSDTESDSVVLGRGDTLTVLITGTIGSGEDCAIELLASDGSTWTDTGEALTSTTTAKNIVAPGTYRFNKPTSSAAYGVDIDGGND